MRAEGGGDGRGAGRRDLVALAPAAGLALVALVCGTFPGHVEWFGVPLPGGASAVGTAGLHLLLVAGALFAAPAWPQPLGLGRRGRFLHLALWATVLAAAWASPVPRAGRVVGILLPAWVLLPAAVARCWGDRRRHLGLTGISWVVAAVAALALADRFAAGSPRAALPLGHHNLLAVWLLALLPVAALGARSPGPGRWAAAAAVGLGGGALLATGSLAGLAGLATLLLVSAARLALRGEAAGRRRWAAAGALAALGIAAVVVAAPRLAVVALGRDPSLAARLTYWRAALDGFTARPLLGWGPGSVPWTLAEWLRPVPGVNPPHELVGDVHSLPLEMLYELGLTGWLLVAALVLLFPWRRLVALPVAVDAALLRAGLLGLLGAGVALLAVAPLAVAAIPVALAVAAGAALAGEGPGRWPGERQRGPRDLPVWLYAGAALFLLLPLDRAHRSYDRSLIAGGGAAHHLLAAVGSDPGFPWYRAQLAWARGGPAAAQQAVEAAESAWGVAGLWLLAGQAALKSGEPWAAIALERACALDPLGATAPYLLAVVEPRSPRAAQRAARALAADPRLAAAALFARHPALLEDALAELARWPGIDAGWREAMIATAGGLRPGAAAAPGELRLMVDGRGAESLALHLFRRRPRPLELAVVPVDGALVRRMRLPPATALPTTSPLAFAGPGCGVPADIVISP